VKAQRIVIGRVGGPEVLRLEDFEASPPAPGEVALEVRAAGLNFADLFCRLGLYEAAPRPPFAPGFEVAGVVAGVGEGVEGFAPGDRAVGLTRFGGYASRINLRSDWLRPLPPGWSFEQGAAFPVVFLTAWYGISWLARLQAGETLVVQSAAGGVGTAACQIGKALGARVIGTVGSAAKQAVALENGADEVIVSRRYRVWRRIRRLTGGEGVDVILDAVGGRGLRRGFEQLRPGGRLVAYGFAEMMPRRGRRNWPLLLWQYLRTPRFNPLTLTGRNRSVHGFNLVHLWDRAELLAGFLDRLLGMADRGELRPVVGATFPFENVAAAHHLLQSRGSTGKVVLVRPGEEG
jgi:NADPH:quinone reductase-like Zn-dependent oxidoreductase